MLAVKIDIRRVLSRYGRMEKIARRPLQIWNRIHRHQRNTSRRLIRRLSKGGRFRGVLWRWFSPNYKVRPSGKRVTRASNLLRDTGRLYANVSNLRRQRGNTLTLITPVEYASYHNNARDPRRRRPFAFFSRSDVQLYSEWAVRELLGLPIRYHESLREAALRDAPPPEQIF